MSKNKNNNNYQKPENPAPVTETSQIESTENVDASKVEESVDNTVENTVQDNENVSVIDAITKAAENEAVSESEAPEEQITDDQKEESPSEGDTSIDPIVAPVVTPVVESEESAIIEEEEVSTTVGGFYVEIPTKKPFDFIDERLAKVGIKVKEMNGTVVSGPYATENDIAVAKKIILGRGFKCNTYTV